jgi:spore germination protein KC
MKKLLLCILIAGCTALGGCYSYKDINRMAFVTAVVIDVDDKGQPDVYAEVFRPFRSESDASGKGQRLIYHAEGKNLDEAFRIMQLGSSHKLDFTQNKAIIFTKRAAEKGLDYFIDFLNRDQQFLLRQFVYLIDDSPSKLLGTNLTEEPYIGIHLSDISLSRKNYANTHTVRMDEYLSKRLIGSKVAIAPFVSINNISYDNKISLSGAAVLQADKYKGKIELGESTEYNIMMNINHRGMLDIRYEDTHNDMALEILYSKAKTSITYDGEQVVLHKKINLKLSFEETQEPLHLNSEDIRRKIEENVEKEMKYKMQRLFEKWKEKGVDIFDMKREFERAYPHAELKTDDIMDVAQLDLEIIANLEGTTHITNFVK